MVSALRFAWALRCWVLGPVLGSVRAESFLRQVVVLTTRHVPAEEACVVCGGVPGAAAAVQQLKLLDEEDQVESEAFKVLRRVKTRERQRNEI